MTSATPSVASGRAPAIDIARGLAVMAVVALHITNGLQPLGLIGDGNVVAHSIIDFGVLRLPALALLLGLFVPGGVAKRGTGGYISSRVVQIGYLYVLWSILQGMVGVVTSGVRNNSTDVLDVLTLWTPELQLWFLPYVIVASVLLALVKPWRHPAVAIVALAVLLAVSAVMWGRNYEVIGAYGLSLLFFSGVGATVGLRRALVVLELPWWLWSIAGVTSAAAFVWVQRFDPRSAVTGESGIPFSLLGASFAACLFGIVALLCVSKVLSLLPGVSEGLQMIGRRTLEVYVMHVILYAGTRVVLLKLGITAYPVHLVVGMLAGVGVPVVVSMLAPRLHLQWLFAPPRRLLAGVAAVSGRARRTTPATASAR